MGTHTGNKYVDNNHDEAFNKLIAKAFGKWEIGNTWEDPMRFGDIWNENIKNLKIQPDYEPNKVLVLKEETTEEYFVDTHEGVNESWLAKWITYHDFQLDEEITIKISACPKKNWLDFSAYD